MIVVAVEVRMSVMGKKRGKRKVGKEKTIER